MTGEVVLLLVYQYKHMGSVHAFYYATSQYYISYVITSVLAFGHHVVLLGYHAYRLITPLPVSTDRPRHPTVMVT